MMKRDELAGEETRAQAQPDSGSGGRVDADITVSHVKWHGKDQGMSVLLAVHYIVQIENIDCEDL